MSLVNNIHANNINVKLLNTFRRFSGCLLAGAATVAVVSCNEKTEDVEIYLTPSNVAVTAFSLNEDDDVMANLDSVFFSIDLANGVIFNADSLPVGTKIDKLVTTIKYSSYVTKATINMENGETRTGEVDYLNSPTDSIDFTGNVTLTLSTDNDQLSRTYRIKMNVHKEKTDSLIWGDKAISKLPSRLPDPRNQKSIDFNNRAVSLIEENDGTYTFATSDNLFESTWQKNAATFPFTPNVRSLCATTSRLFLLATDGKMYESADGSSWTATGETWTAMLGSYLDTAIGIRNGANGAEYAQYPQKNLNVCAIDPEFPVSGYSNFVILENQWTSSPVGFFAGGTCADGSLSDATWAFDGYNWIKLAEGGIPAVKGASIIPYYGFRFTSSTWTKTEYPVWMIVGGTKTDGTLNRTVYISYDNGVNWGQGSELLQLPKEIPTMTECDNVVMNVRKKALLSDAWKKAARRSHNVEVDGDNIYWDCPYIYLIGGFGSDGKLYDTVWRGVIARLSFTPII